MSASSRLAELAPLCWRYLLLIAGGNLELARLPLYTIWRSPGPRAAVEAAIHCTFGDVLLAAAALGGALVLLRAWDWPQRRIASVSVMATALGMVATGTLEGLQTQIWKGWAYTEGMPIVPWLEVGLSPFLQWLVLPPLMLWGARRWVARRRS